MSEIKIYLPAVAQNGYLAVRSRDDVLEIQTETSFYDVCSSLDQVRVSFHGKGRKRLSMVR
jgi:hypothetical protein